MKSLLVPHLGYSSVVYLYATNGSQSLPATIFKCGSRYIIINVRETSAILTQFEWFKHSLKGHILRFSQCIHRLVRGRGQYHFWFLCSESIRRKMPVWKIKNHLDIFYMFYEMQSHLFRSNAHIYGTRIRS